VRLVPTRQALQLTGLTPARLREWSNRRALIPADVPPKSQGSSAQYSWQTILVLRLALTLKGRFCLELKAHRGVFTTLRRSLDGQYFIALWDHALALGGTAEWALIREADHEPLETDSIILRLNPHLEVLAAGFALPNPRRDAGQLDLFPATPVAQTAKLNVPRTTDVSRGQHRRRLA
jgi:hypothetical protein